MAKDLWVMKAGEVEEYFFGTSGGAYLSRLGRM